ncbi:DNA adenine methylase [Bienertia sinuspersici]
MELITAASVPRYSSLVQSSNNDIFSNQISISHSCSSTTAIRFRSLNSRSTFRFSHSSITCNSLHKSSEDSSSDRIAVLLEVDGVLIDAYRSGNLQAFNVGAAEATKGIRF